MRTAKKMQNDCHYHKKQQKTFKIQFKSSQKTLTNRKKSRKTLLKTSKKNLFDSAKLDSAR
jgi:hypothetical protein